LSKTHPFGNLLTGDPAGAPEAHQVLGWNPMAKDSINFHTKKDVPLLDTSGIRILLVDDEASIRQMLKKGLRRHGYSCETAENGVSALKLLSKRDFDIVIADIKMPEMDGIELTQVVKSKYQAEVIVITGYYEDFHYEEMIEIGASDFLEKPIRLEELNVRILRVLREREAFAQLRAAAKKIEENERVFRKTFESIPVPAFLWERLEDGRIVLSRFNRAGYDVTDGEIADSLGAELERYHSHQPEIVKRVKQTMASGRSYHEQRPYISRSTGQEYWLDINYTQPFENCILVVSPDITRQKLAEEELRRLSYLDALSGIPNRRYFEETIRREWRRAVRYKKPISLIMADIDHFKAFNDTYGHPAGDNCLKKVVTALQNALKRPADMIARYGGEEFAAILPETSRDGAQLVAETQRVEVEALEIENPHSDVSSQVTISLGVASATPEQNSTSEVIVSAADQALYRAKSAGRNQVAV